MASVATEGRLALVARRPRRTVLGAAAALAALALALAAGARLARRSRLAGVFASAPWRAFLRLTKQQPPLVDPVFGVQLQAEHLGTAWEALLDGLSLRPDSPIRAHIRQLFARPEFDEELRGLFDELLGSGGERLGFAEFERFSRGIQGDLHVLLSSKTKVSLVDAKAEELAWMEEHFDVVFGPDRPLVREVFPSLAKLILLRRVLRTLVEKVGLGQLQEGMSKPLVVQVLVELGPSKPPFRLLTVAPSSARGSSSGQSLGPISEDEEG